VRDAATWAGLQELNVAGYEKPLAIISRENEISIYLSALTKKKYHTCARQEKSRNANDLRRKAGMLMTLRVI